MLVMVPSRERPHNVARFAKAASETITASDVLFILDSDDPVLDDSINAASPWRIYIQQPPLRQFTAKINAVAMANVNDYPVLMFAGDDTVPHTPGWDTLLTEAITEMGGTGYAYPDAYPDGNAGSGCRERPEHVAISADIVKALGWFACPMVNHFTADCIWDDIGRGADCLQWVPQAVVEHMHWSRGGRKDHLLQRAISNAAADYEGYALWRSGQMEADIATVKKLRESNCPG